jgi:Arc/MetJ-type ribon-helix-helix transcriptional regulator
MRRTNIYLDDEQVRALRHLAAEERASVAELVRQAVDGYLARRFRETPDWAQCFDEIVARYRDGVPPDLPPEEIEEEITASRREYCAERATARDSAGADEGGR